METGPEDESSGQITWMGADQVTKKFTISLLFQLTNCCTDETHTELRHGSVLSLQMYYMLMLQGAASKIHGTISNVGG